jgi:hypothetical protein
MPERITPGQEKEDFVDFMLQTLRWLPEKRMTVAELQKHPWLVRWQTPPDQS